ncbi:DUF6232 family protein [Streptomyces sp. NPDC002057]|uniref:DUF6232 family protein n=1 Tax=Streptomyces sp. NPDC002057 TaxID=3154664 RepID=UPI00331DFACC
MDSTGNNGPTPPGSAPSGPPPPRNPPPAAPPQRPWERSPAVQRDGTLILQVSRRILWVGSAAIPLHNITRVEAFRLKPDRGAALLRFLKWLVVAVVVYAVINTVNGGDESIGGGGGPLLFVVLIALAAFLCKELFEPARSVLAVETAGGSVAHVTLPSVDELREIAGRIAYAIDNPEAEFTAIVQQFNSSNTNNFGPVVNMNGGRNNRGINL